MSCYCGARPGGRRKFALSLFEVEAGGMQQVSRPATDTADALDWLFDRLAGRELHGLGVCAPLSWTPRAGHWREVDRYLRKTYPEIARRLISPAGRRGSAIIGGALLVLRLRELWPALAVTEVRPVAVETALIDLGRDIPLLRTPNPDAHLRQAEIAAYCAFAAHTDRDGWIDLHQVAGQDDEAHLPCGPFTHHFPTVRRGG